MLGIDQMFGMVDFIVDYVHILMDHATMVFTNMFTLFWDYSHHSVPIAIVIAVFWPLFVTLLMALTTASSWCFWLVTSMALGVVQLIYVSYQFAMISCDIVGLSALKTWAMLHSQLRYMLGDRRRHLKGNRRREWRRLVDACPTYEEFLKEPIEEKSEEEILRTIKRQEQQVGSSKKNKNSVFRATIQRTNSWKYLSSSLALSSSIDSSNTDGKGKSNATPPGQLSQSKSFGTLENSPFNGIIRNKSFDDKKRSNSSNDLVMDDENEDENNHPNIAEQELGMTGNMVLATTTRLREARLQASEENTYEASSALKRLLSGVIKRNHLTLEDFLVDNAKSIFESGQYGLSKESRSAIYGFYEEIEKGLDWIADSPLLTEQQEQEEKAKSNKDSQTNSGDPSQHGSTENSTQSSVNNDSIDSIPETLETPKFTQETGEAAVLPSSVVTAEDVTSDALDDAGSTAVRREQEIAERITLVRRMKQNMGRTALMLSGGGAQAMYHLGTVRALIQSKVYDDIKVVSGTSGGSITAAMCALKTPEELYEHVAIPTVSTDYRHDGRMKRENIRWFPSVVEMGAYWLKNRLLVDSADFKRCCDFYYEDVTFEEAFNRTGKHVCITVSANRASGGGQSAQRLLLNHISTPHVTLASAVAASCALPGVMAPTKLFTKSANGKQEPFEVDGVEWIDGSVQADLPFQRISTLFNVSNYVVCQTNFHVVPLVNKAHQPSRNSLYWRLFQTWEWDIRNRALKLSRLGLFPRIFGQDISKLFKQKYHGNLTLVPRFTTMQTFGLQALSNPSVKDMEGYLRNGQLSAWPYLKCIKDMTRLEIALDNCLNRLDERFKTMIPESDYDEVDSIASSSLVTTSISNRVRFIGAGRESERLKTKVISLERENLELKKKLQEMERRLIHGVVEDLSFGSPTDLGNGMARSTSNSSQFSSSSDEGETSKRKSPRESKVSEREVWSLRQRHGPKVIASGGKAP
mmetsp:Transcript_7646/g.10892  ORF Transcript_7646/g.10892 Transcript_7646/m.10892 type:complete len:977 (-) Transcript_7646:498-3428(-)